MCKQLGLACGTVARGPDDDTQATDDDVMEQIAAKFRKGNGFMDISSSPEGESKKPAMVPQSFEQCFVVFSRQQTFSFT